LSGLNLESDESLIWTQASGRDEAGSLFIYRDEGGSGSLIYGGGATGNPAIFSLNQTIQDGDRYAIVEGASGHKRLRSMSFEIVTSKAPLPVQDLIAGTLGSGAVLNWSDQSQNGNDATASIGTVTYPSSIPSSSGLYGLDFGDGRTSLELFSANESDSWLDQAQSSSGFCILISATIADIIPGVFNDLLGNSTDGITGLQLGWTQDGQIRAILGGISVSKPADNLLQTGDSIVIALNYDAATESLELWDTLTRTSIFQSVSKADFSTNNPVTLGSIDDSSQFINGAVGEVKIYEEALDTEEFSIARNGMTGRWVSSPNIIMILADDLAWYDTPVLMDDRMLNSAQAPMRRLNIDGEPYRWNMQRLADEGMLFRNAYAAAPQCTPTRASLQTGQSTARTRVAAYLSGGLTRQEYDLSATYANFPVIPNGAALPLDGTTIPEVLNPLGYRCAHYGKWHLDSDPGAEGYLEHDGATNNAPGETITGSTIPANMTNPKRITEITDKTLSFMDASLSEGRPFYIQLSHYAAHFRSECFPESRALFQQDPDVLAFNNNESDPEQLNRRDDPAAFYGMMYDLDRSIGQLLDELDRLGIANNTYIVFKSDNGFRRFDIPNFKQPLFGDKWFLWEGGLRIPMMITGPGIPAGQVSTVNVVTYDLLPTFYEWAGGVESDLIDMDGRSLKSLLEGSPLPEFVNRSIYFHFPHYRKSLPMSAVVKGKYKLVHSYDATIREDITVSNANSLFDVSVDPGEFNNLNTSPVDNEIAADLWLDLDGYLTSVEAWRPLDNSDSYIQSEFQDDQFYDVRADFAHFEGKRMATNHLNDDDRTMIQYWFEFWGESLSLNGDIGVEEDDFDLDGVTNLEEYFQGSDPTDINSGTTFKVSPSITDTDFLIAFESRPYGGGVPWNVETTDNLSVGWSNNTDNSVSETIMNNGLMMHSISIPNALDKAFARLRLDSLD
ncbi:MAG: sulfatase-like hydrolase/transferase, partial [Verrucomicrobiota bacterium]